MRKLFTASTGARTLCWKGPNLSSIDTGHQVLSVSSLHLEAVTQYRLSLFLSLSLSLSRVRDLVTACALVVLVRPAPQHTSLRRPASWSRRGHVSGHKKRLIPAPCEDLQLETYRSLTSFAIARCCHSGAWRKKNRTAANANNASRRFP